MNAITERRVRIRKHLNVKTIDGETVILNRDTNKIHTLNSTASLIWGMISTGTAWDDIVINLTDSFGISTETANSDLQAILNDLNELELIEYDVK